MRLGRTTSSRKYKNMRPYPFGVQPPSRPPTGADLAAFRAAIGFDAAPANSWIDTGIQPGSAWAIRSMIVGAKDALFTELGNQTSGEANGNFSANATDTLVNSNGAAWFSSLGLFVWGGGGHGGYPGNEMYWTHVPSMTWGRFNDPSPMARDPGNPAATSWRTLDGTPKSAHTYGGIVAVESQNAVYILHGSPWPEGNYIGDLWKFDLATLTWTKVYDQPMSPRTAYEPHAHWVESQQKIAIGWSRWWRWYDPFTNTVGPMVTSVADVGLTSTVATDTGIYSFHSGGSGGGCDFISYANLGTVAPASVKASYPQFSAYADWATHVAWRWNSYLWDPVRQMVIAWSNNLGTADEGKRVFAIDFINGRLYEFVTSGSYPDCSALGTFSKWQYLPDLDAYIGLNNRAISNGWMVFKPGTMTQVA